MKILYISKERKCSHDTSKDVAGWMMLSEDFDLNSRNLNALSKVYYYLLQDRKSLHNAVSFLSNTDNINNNTIYLLWKKISA